MRCHIKLWMSLVVLTVQYIIKYMNDMSYASVSHFFICDSMCSFSQIKVT